MTIYIRQVAAPVVVRVASLLHMTPMFVCHYYGRPLSVSGRPYFANVFFLIFFYGRLILRPWLTEVRESFTRGGP